LLLLVLFPELIHGMDATFQTSAKLVDAAELFGITA
jgi:hypothetical protein